MLSEVGDTVLILFPLYYIDGTISPCSDILRSDIHKAEVCVSK